jgi:hypothetical protein
LKSQGRGIVSEDESDDDELDSNSSNEVETVTSNDSDADTDPHSSPTNERDQLESLIRHPRDFSHALYFVFFGLVIGLLTHRPPSATISTKMVKPEEKDSSEDDEDMNSEPGASSAFAEPASFAELMARDANKKTAANTVSQISLPEGEGRGTGKLPDEIGLTETKTKMETKRKISYSHLHRSFVPARSTTSTSK